LGNIYGIQVIVTGSQRTKHSLNVAWNFTNLAEAANTTISRKHQTEFPKIRNFRSHSLHVCLPSSRFLRGYLSKNVYEFLFSIKGNINKKWETFFCYRKLCSKYIREWVRTLLTVSCHVLLMDKEQHIMVHILTKHYTSSS
jgi:hypothetical protein